MSETPTVAPSEPSTPPSSAADQARIRKERREAKIRAGGSARLNKITGLGGGLQRGMRVQDMYLQYGISNSVALQMLHHSQPSLKQELILQPILKR